MACLLEDVSGRGGVVFMVYLSITAAEYTALLVTPSPLPPSSIVINGSTEFPNARYPNNAKENDV